MTNLKPRNGGEWTESRYQSFIKSALRGARWPQKYKAIQGAYIKDGVNPATGRKCKLHLCCECGGEFPASGVQADHIEPVVPLTGFDSWDALIERLYCEVEGFQVMCRGCHKIKTKEENAIRRANKKVKNES